VSLPASTAAAGTTLDFSARRLVVLAASAFVVLAAEPLFLLVDTAVVGHLGRVQLAALGDAAYGMSVLAVLAGALEYGTTSRASRLYGAGDQRAAVREGVHASWLGASVGLLAVGIGELGAAPFTRFVAGDDAAVAQDAERWLRIALIGLPALLLVLAGNGWLRGVQNTRSPVLIVLVANIASAIASPVLVYPMGLGLTGSAWANVLAQWLGAALCLRALFAQHVSARPDWRVIRILLVLSRDLVLRSAAFEIAFLCAASVAGRMGSAQLAAHQIGIQLWSFLALLLDSFGIAAMALVPAALGSGDAAVATRTAWRVTRFGVIAGTVFAALMAAGWTVIPALFSSDSAVRNQAGALWPWLVGMLPVAGVVFALDGVLLGAGDNRFVGALTMVSALGVFVPISLAALHFGWGIGGVWAGIAAFIGIRCMGMVLRTRGNRWLVVGVAR
jgi:putative MATE family efflux protein